VLPGQGLVCPEMLDGIAGTAQLQVFTVMVEKAEEVHPEPLV
jgi:hypothetical protein